MICSHCQAENIEGALACTACGAALKLQPTLAGTAGPSAEAKLKYCRKCGAAYPADSAFCEECGADLSAVKKTTAFGRSVQSRQAVGTTSAAWWLLPIFFNLLGGLIAWAVLRDKDPGKARSLLITGIILAVLWVILSVILVMIGAFTFADISF